MTTSFNSINPFIDQLVQNQTFIFSNALQKASLVQMAEDLPCRQFLQSLAKSLQKDHASVRFVEADGVPGKYTVTVSEQTRQEELLDALISVQRSLHTDSPLPSPEKGFLTALENGDEETINEMILDSVALQFFADPSGFQYPETCPAIQQHIEFLKTIDTSQIDRSKLFDIRSVDDSGIATIGYLNSSLIKNPKVDRAFQYVMQALEILGHSVKHINSMIEPKKAKPLKATFWSQLFSWITRLADWLCS